MFFLWSLNFLKILENIQRWWWFGNTCIRTVSKNTISSSGNELDTYSWTFSFRNLFPITKDKSEFEISILSGFLRMYETCLLFQICPVEKLISRLKSSKISHTCVWEKVDNLIFKVLKKSYDRETAEFMNILSYLLDVGSVTNLTVPLFDIKFLNHVLFDLIPMERAVRTNLLIEFQESVIRVEYGRFVVGYVRSDRR